MKLPSSEQQDFADTVAALLEKRDPLAPMRHAVGRRTHDRDLWSELTAAGVLEPAEAGDLLTACLVAEALGRRAAPLPYLAASLGASLVAGAGGTPDGLVTIGLLGADGLWSAAPLSLVEGRVSGVLPFVPDADAAAAVVALVEQPAGPRAVLIPLPGAEVTVLETLDGTQPLARVRLTDRPAELLPADAATVTAAVAATGELAVALHSATVLGLVGWLLDTTVEYAGQRVQFGMPIAARQAVKHHCATMLMKVESIRSMVLELADVLENDSDPVARASAVATTKAWTAEAAEEIAATALQLHGGIGFTWEHDLHHYFKRCTMASRLLGTAAHHRQALASLLAGTTRS
ncbi:acyl-CoA dehydrogenase family protein [Nocardioides pantholopis]|uniref:acyl-CoA dehydrogenase family protein n=1 Tax=Nocardioides pantholopis TaxID=2483798 RepID=UPI000F08090A|nr:acyl-CoA dehydrogenase family protein [Nocardioides pantholopis]